MPPFWKIRRELRRVAGQIATLPQDTVGYLLSTAYYDRVLARRVRRRDGEVAPSAKFAVYVIYPNHGVQPSHRRCLDELVAHGYAPIVVSNYPLDDEAVDRVAPRCWRIIERPNFGYDFGAYRDGILSIAGELESAERLLLVNDSCWFPLPDCRDWIGEGESMGRDLVGAASHYGARFASGSQVDDFEWRYDSHGRNFHYGSFALLMSARLISDPGFVAFWRRLRLTGRKNKTVRRGEIGISQWAIRRGCSHASMLDIAALESHLRSLAPGDLADVLADTIILDNDRLREMRRCLVKDDFESPAVCQRAIRLILAIVAKEGASYALGPHLVSAFRHPFLKKSPVRLSREGARATLKLLKELELRAPGSGLYVEAIALRQGDGAAPPDDARQTAVRASSDG